jgi:arginyl-tRNA synthetase
MMKHQDNVKEQIIALLQQAVMTMQLTPPPQIQLTRCRQKEHGDFATNIAMNLAKQAGKSPRELAQQLVDHLGQPEGIEAIEVAGPGFINFRLAQIIQGQVIEQVLAEQDQYGRVNVGAGKKVHLEYVSANPTGPLHVGHGRGAAYGSSLARLLDFAGFSVHSEYYVNDAGRQMNILAVSVWLRYLELRGVRLVFPANAYQGDYIIDIARTLAATHGDAFYHDAGAVFANLPTDEPQGGDKEVYIDALISRARSLLGEPAYRVVHDDTRDAILADIKGDLAEFGTDFDEWFCEQSLFDQGAVEHAVNRLQQTHLTYEQNGALWFKSTDFGDDKDRVLVRDNGQTTYFASDAAYLVNKFDRGYDEAICILGADHHGYIVRLRALLTAYGYEPSQLTIPVVQFAVLYRHGEQVKMSTRSGSFVTLRELREEVGTDAARFFYNMRKVEQHLDFDLDLAKSKSNDNPVYYVQYAHARIESVMRQLTAQGGQYDATQAMRELDQLTLPHESDLLDQLARFPELITQCAAKYEVHQMTYYLRELANAFHSYYNVQKFVDNGAPTLQARIALILAVRQVLRNGLTILGVSAPEAM